jgi:hypothetical protein
MPPNLALQIERQYNGIINCIENSKSNPKSFETSLKNYKSLTKIQLRDFSIFFKLALQNNRADIVSILMNINKKNNNFVDDNDEDSDEDPPKINIYNDIFLTICRKRSLFLKYFLNSDWINHVDISCVYEILIKKIKYNLIQNGDHMLTEYMKQELYLNQHLNYSQKYILQHKKGAKLILDIETKFKIPLNISYNWHLLNPELKIRRQTRINARWTLIFFFCKYVKPGIHNWLWAPGGYMFKKGEKHWNENYNLAITN